MYKPSPRTVVNYVPYLLSIRMEIRGVQLTIFYGAFPSFNKFENFPTKIALPFYENGGSADAATRSLISAKNRPSVSSEKLARFCECPFPYLSSEQQYYNSFITNAQLKNQMFTDTWV